MVDGAIEARQTHGRIVPIEFRGTPQRGLPAMESQWQPNERSRKRHITTEQRAGGGETTAAEVEEHVQEALFGIRSGSVPKSRCSGARETEGWGSCITEWQQEGDEALLIDEEVVHRQPRIGIACTGSESALELARGFAPTTNAPAHLARSVASTLETRLSHPRALASTP
jgi:hypothetical protein